MIEFLMILGIVFILYVVWRYWALVVGAGYDPTPFDKVDKMLNIAGVDKDDVVYDLGCGDGRVLIAAARRYGARAVGIEIDPFRFFFSWCMVRFSGLGKRIKVRYGDFFKHEISEATVVILFLYGPTNNRLRKKLSKELKPGSRVVSYTWIIEGWECEEFLPEDRVFLYVVD